MPIIMLERDLPKNAREKIRPAVVGENPRKLRYIAIMRLMIQKANKLKGFAIARTCTPPVKTFDSPTLALPALTESYQIRLGSRRATKNIVARRKLSCLSRMEIGSSENLKSSGAGVSRLSTHFRVAALPKDWNSKS